jgi:gliding motility-associated-like protein
MIKKNWFINSKIALGLVNLLVLYLASFQLYGQAQIAFPDAEGFGAKTRGAYSGSNNPKILIVDNLDASAIGNEVTGRGTFQWCISRPYPRIVLFEVGGVIDYRNRNVNAQPHLYIDDPYITIAGQTAPDPGITIIGIGLYIDADDVIMQHIRIRHGDHPNGVDPDGRDCITIFSSRIIIDHCSFAWATDELVDIVRSQDLTISNCILSEPLVFSLVHETEGDREPVSTGYAMLINQGQNITLKDNLFAFSYDRHPLTRVDNILLINNMMYNSGGFRMGVNFQRGLVNASYIGNLVLRAPDVTNSLSKYAGFVMSGVHPGSVIFVQDNICVRSIENPSISEQGKFFIENPDFQFSEITPISLDGYRILLAQDLEEDLLKNVGTKPFERDAIDHRIIQNVRNRQGKYINSPDSLPARAYNYSQELTGTSAGNMSRGFDWAANPKSMVINGETISLNETCNSIQEVRTYIEPQLPVGVETFIAPGGNFIGFRTTLAGSSQVLVVSGNGLAAFGIPAGTYYGSDGDGFPDYPAVTRSLASISTYPQTNPHVDDNGNGFTRLQEWIHAMGIGTSIVLGPETLPNGPETVCQGTNQSVYNTLGADEAISYLWHLTPSSAGIVSGSGKMAQIHWNLDFSGVCFLSFVAQGHGDFSASSPALKIEITPLPKKPTPPAGENSIYQGSSYSDYETGGSLHSEDYQWQLQPDEAGAVQVSGTGIACRIFWDEIFFGEASLVVSGMNDCGIGPSSDPLLIQVLEPELGAGIISAFTPNGDGVNDYWHIPFIRDYPNASIKLFDRNNRLIHEYSGTDSSWNGAVNGMPVPMGNYLYVIDLGSGRKPIKGYVTVLH